MPHLHRVMFEHGLQTLGLKPGRNYSPDEIKKAYRRKVMKAHPDAGGSQVEFIAVVNAYDWLRTCL
jgi:curved DNA-binding protein CbpA